VIASGDSGGFAPARAEAVGPTMVEWVDPLNDPGWPELVERHPRASVFHTRGWLEALQRTYGYEPVALRSGTPGEQLASGMVFCRVESWLTGRRLVSLPFSDHCDPLVEEGREQEWLRDALGREQARGKWKYVELRPYQGRPRIHGGFGAANRYYLHRLDLRADSNALFSSFHKNHVVRKIRRGEREKLRYVEGSSDLLLRSFYGLLLQTRRRHGLPPQPLRWFRAVLDCLPKQARIRVAFKDSTPVASILTLRKGDTMVYKYGASDAKFHAIGGMHFLIWRTIQDARELGCVTLDLGRSEIDNKGLIAFKEHWGATRSPLVYWRSSIPRRANTLGRLVGHLARRVLPRVPDRLLIAVGSTLYRHIG
jgi:CelD/BcsL family acetyltransferase involved in cellulose biosynthesis